MPAKKEGGKKKGGEKSAKKPAVKSVTKLAGEPISEMTKEFYLVQILDLENRLVRYQRKCDELSVGSAQFQEKYDNLAKEKHDMNENWKKQLEQKNDEIDDLNDRLLGLQQAKDAEHEQSGLTLQQVRTEYQDMKDRLTSENMILSGKLASLEEFRVQKEDLMGKFRQMEEELRRKEQENIDTIYALERKGVIDKDRLKKEMIQRVNQVAAEFRKVSNKQMAETTKRTIRENVSINSQLLKMSDKTMELIQENDELKQKEKNYKQQIELLEANEKELARKNYSNLKMLRMLTEKCQTQESIINDYGLREKEFEECEAENELLCQQLTATKEEMQILAQFKEDLMEKLRTTEENLKEMSQVRSKLEQVLADAAEALRNALRRTGPEESQDGHRIPGEEEEDDLSEVEQRDHMLEHLLILLNSAAALGIGPPPADLGKQYGEQVISRLPGSGKGLIKGQVPLSPISKAGGTLPHYSLGDLGLIPRPAQPIPTSVDKMRDLSATTRLGGLRRVLTKSAATQTVSAPKALFYADQLLSKMPVAPGQRTPVLEPIGTRKISSKVF